MKGSPDKGKSLVPGSKNHAETGKKDSTIEKIVKTVRKHPLLSALLASSVLHAHSNPDLRKWEVSLFDSSAQTTQDEEKNDQKPHRKDEDKNKPKEPQRDKEQKKAEKNLSLEMYDTEDDGAILVQTPEETEDMLNKIDERLARIDPEKLRIYKEKMLARLKRGENIPLRQLVFDLEGLAGIDHSELEKAQAKQEIELNNLIPQIPPEGLTKEFIEEVVNGYFTQKHHEWGQASYAECVNTDECNCFVRELGLHILMETIIFKLPPDQRQRYIQGNIYEKQHEIAALWEVDAQNRVIRTFVLQPPMQVIEHRANDDGTAFLDLFRFKKSLLGERQTIVSKGDQKKIKKTPRIISEHNQPLDPAITIVGKLIGSDLALGLAEQVHKNVEEEKKVHAGEMEVVPLDPGPAAARKMVLRGVYGLTKFDGVNVVNATDFISPSLATVENLLHKSEADISCIYEIILGDVTEWSEESLKRIFTSKHEIITSNLGRVPETYLHYTIRPDIHGKLPKNLKKVWLEANFGRNNASIKLVKMNHPSSRLPLADFKVLLDGGDKRWSQLLLDMKTITQDEAAVLNQYGNKRYYFRLEQLEDIDDETLEVLAKDGPTERIYNISAETYLKIALRNPKIFKIKKIEHSVDRDAKEMFTGTPDEISLLTVSAEIFLVALSHGEKVRGFLSGSYHTSKANHETGSDGSFRDLLARAIQELGSNQNVEEAMAALKAVASSY